MGAGYMRGHPASGDPGGGRAGEAVGPRGPPSLPGQTRQAAPYFILDKKCIVFLATFWVCQCADFLSEHLVPASI
jgi:hypothetical protein